MNYDAEPALELLGQLAVAVAIVATAYVITVVLFSL